MITSDEMDRTFRASLAALTRDVGGLRALDCATWGTAAPLPRLCFAGQAGGYYVHAALRPDAGRPADRWSTWLSAVWVPEEGERRTPLDIRLEGTGARDGRLLAALVLTAVLTDHDGHEEA